jgi:serine/threonine protein phosphatase PrpC
MGGHLGGEQASRTALTSISRYVLDMMHWFLKLRPNEEQDFLDELSDSLRVGQERLWSECGKRNRGMGTTLTMSYLIWPKMYVVHAGDSRCYLLRGGKLEQLTTDHTLAQQLLEQGAITSEEAARSKWRHVLWNCVGGQDEPVRPEALRCRLEVGDTLLLCTDGLTGMVGDDMIASILQRSQSSSVAVGNLIDAAKAAGGSDNISVIVCRFIEVISGGCDPSSENRSDADDTTEID